MTAWRILAVAVLLGLGSAAHAALLAGTVIAVSGPATSSNRAIAPGAAIQVGDTVAVPTNSQVKLRMADGSIVSIASDSKVTVATYTTGGAGRDVRLTMPQGLMRITVSPAGGASGFTVSSGGSTASVQSDGADWFIDAERGVAQVGVLMGRVKLVGATNHSVSIPAHWGTRLETGLDPMLPRAWAQVEFDAFIRRTECCQQAAPKPPRPTAGG